MPLRLLVSFVCLFVSLSTNAGELSTFVEQMKLEALRDTFNATKVQRILEGKGASYSFSEQQSAAVLVSVGVITPADLNSPARIEKKMEQFGQGRSGKFDHLLGPFNESVTQARLDNIGDHQKLLKEAGLISLLHSLLGEGVVTGYDLRKANIADGFDPERTLTYSHSSIPHIKQLTALLSSEEVQGLLYAVPKISAFLFREDWGNPPKNVSALKDGRLVVNGREWVVFFEFAHLEDKLRFHQIVNQYAKKDDDNEPGLIVDSWWQPFYYSSIKTKELQPIKLILLRSATTEATLTVLPDRLDAVLSGLSTQSTQSWDISIEDIWVNKPFYRFLNGGFK